MEMERPIRPSRCSLKQMQSSCRLDTGVLVKCNQEMERYLGLWGRVVARRPWQVLWSSALFALVCCAGWVSVKVRAHCTSMRPCSVERMHAHAHALYIQYFTT